MFLSGGLDFGCCVVACFRSLNFGWFELVHDYGLGLLPVQRFGVPVELLGLWYCRWVVVGVFGGWLTADCCSFVGCGCLGVGFMDFGFCC